MLSISVLVSNMPNSVCVSWISTKYHTRTVLTSIIVTPIVTFVTYLLHVFSVTSL